MEYFIQQLVNGITLGSIYGLIAIGYTMVYGIIGMINFAHGDIFMIGAFVALISLMDNFRVFEPIIGFSAEGSAQSLSWLIYDNLVNEEVILFGSAAATSIMTIIGISIILAPVLIRTWREFRTSR